MIDLFLPKSQKALSGRLAFCAQQPGDLDKQAKLSSVVSIPKALEDAIEELFKFGLIKRESRTLMAHRVVQEAMNYHTANDLQDYFNSATALVYEAFPKQISGDYLTSKQWGACDAYIYHGSHLALNFSTLHYPDKDETLIG